MHFIIDLLYAWVLHPVRWWRRLGVAVTFGPSWLYHQWYRRRAPRHFDLYQRRIAVQNADDVFWRNVKRCWYGHAAYKKFSREADRAAEYERRRGRL